jgi:hypothetical protein
MKKNIFGMLAILVLSLVFTAVAVDLTPERQFINTHGSIVGFTSETRPDCECNSPEKASRARPTQTCEQGICTWTCEPTCINESCSAE